MAKKKSAIDHFLGSVRNAGAFGILVGVIGGAVAFSTAPLLIWPAILTTGAYVALGGAALYGSVSTIVKAFDDRIPFLFVFLGAITGITSAIYVARNMSPNIGSKQFGGRVTDILSSTAKTSFGNNWQYADKGRTFNMNVPLGKTTVPVTATLIDKNVNVFSYDEHMKVKTCLTFNAATNVKAEPAIKKPFQGTIELCDDRRLTQDEVMHMLPPAPPSQP